MRVGRLHQSRSNASLVSRIRPLGIGDDHRLLGHAHLAADLLELILGDQHPYRAELQHHVRDGLADQASRGNVGRGPRLGRPLDQLMPLRERPPRRQIRRIVTDHEPA